jgi:hypothetical protein
MMAAGGAHVTKWIRELGPLAVGVALVGLLIAWLLQDGSTVGNWLLATFLLGHGWVHTMYLMRQPQPAAATATATAGGPDWPFELDHSWLLGNAARTSPVQLLGKLLVATTLVLYTLAALATIPLFVPATMWTTLVIAASVASAVLMLVYFHRNLLIGLAIDAVLLWVAITGVWSPAA